MLSKLSLIIGILPLILVTIVGTLPVAVASETEISHAKAVTASKPKIQPSSGILELLKHSIFTTQRNINANQSASELIPVLLDNDLEISEKAFQDLKRLGFDVAIPALVEALQDKNWEVRVMAAYTLGRFGSNSEIIISALTIKDEMLQSNATFALGQIGSSEAVPTLTKNLRNYRGHLRYYSAVTLGEIGDRQATPALIRVLQQELDRQELDIYVISSLIEALGSIYSSENQYDLVLAYLINVLKEESDSFIHQAAVISLGKIKAEEAIPYIIESLKDKNWAVRLEAANALKSIGSEAIPHPIKILQSNQNYSSPLRVALKDKNADHRRSAAYVLWQMGSLAREAEKDLVAIVEDDTDNLHVRWMAAMALENMGMDMGWFFQHNNLIEPEKLTPTQCPNDIYDPEFDSESTLGIYYSMYKVDLNKIVYAGRCIYGDIANFGGNTYGFYERIKLLLSRK